MLGRMCLIFWPELDEKKRVDLLATVMLDWALITPLVIMGGLLPYGRYTYRQKMVYVDSKIGWVLQVMSRATTPCMQLLLPHSKILENKKL